MHRLRNLDKASNVASSDQARQLALLGRNVLVCSLKSNLKGILHDVLELLIDLLRSPRQALAVLCHLQTRHGDTTGVGGLSWGVPDRFVALVGALGLEEVNGILGAAHVGTLGNDEAASVDEGLGLLLADFVLGRRGERDVDFAGVDPGTSALDVLELAFGLEVGQGAALDLESGNLIDLGGGETFTFGNEGTLGVGEGDDGGAELHALEGGVLGDVAGSRDGDALAGESAAAGVLKHVVDVVDETVASSLCACVSDV